MSQTQNPLMTRLISNGLKITADLGGFGHVESLRLRSRITIVQTQRDRPAGRPVDRWPDRFAGPLAATAMLGPG